MIRTRIGGLSVASHIAADDPKLAGKQGNPVIPETQISSEAVLNPDRFSLLPRICEIVEFVIHLVIVSDDLRHLFDDPARDSPPRPPRHCAFRQRISKLASLLGRVSTPFAATAEEATHRAMNRLRFWARGDK
jgi:hypothetical protein